MAQLQPQLVHALLSQYLSFCISYEYLYGISVKRIVQEKSSELFFLMKMPKCMNYYAITFGITSLILMTVSKNLALSQKILEDWLRLPESQELLAGLGGRVVEDSNDNKAISAQRGNVPKNVKWLITLAPMQFSVKIMALS